MNVLILTDGIKELLGITQEIFPEIIRLIEIILTYPVTSCKGERSFSLLRRVLTWNRSSMTPDRLINLEWMAMHPKRLASISDISVFNSFISSGPRKLVYRRLGEETIFFIYFQPSYGILLFLTLNLT